MINFKIHAVIATKRISQNGVASATGITHSVMKKYYHGAIALINPKHLDSFCKLFNCQIQDLIEYAPDEEKLY